MQNLNHKYKQQEEKEVGLCTTGYLSELVIAVSNKPAGIEFESLVMQFF